MELKVRVRLARKIGAGAPLCHEYQKLQNVWKYFRFEENGRLSITWKIPANNSDWLPTGDANSVYSWQGAVKAPDLCGGKPMDDVGQAVFTATVAQMPPSGSLVDFRFKYRDPAAKGKPNTNCLDTTDPNRSVAAICGASWSATIRDP